MIPLPHLHDDRYKLSNLFVEIHHSFNGKMTRRDHNTSNTMVRISAGTRLLDLRVEPFVDAKTLVDGAQTLLMYRNISIYPRNGNEERDAR